MLTLWYIILGWKEYNKPLRKVEQPPKAVEPDKKPDLIPLKKDGPPTKPTDIKPPPPSVSIPIVPQPPAPRSPDFPSVNDKPTEIPKMPEPKTNSPSPKIPETPKTPAISKLPEPFKPTPKTPESPKTLPEPFKPTPKTPESPKTLPEPFKPSPKTPETPRTPDDFTKATQPPTPPPRNKETPKLSDFKLAPEPPKKPDISPKTPDTLPKTFPSRSSDSTMPEFPISGKNPAYVPPPNQSEFPLPPYLPGAPQNKPTTRDDELFSMGSPISTPSPNKPLTDLRDLSYAKGEFPGKQVEVKMKETASRIPRYMEQSVISNPDSLESDEEEVEEEEEEHF